MNKIARALGAVTVSAVVASGLVGAAAPSSAGAGTAVRALSLLRADTPTTITGTGAVGSTLTRTLPVWNLLDVQSSTQWLKDGAAIPGATGAEYVPTAADAGSTVQAAVTGRVLGIVPVTSYSNGIQVPGGPGEPEESVLTLLGGLEPPADAEVGRLIVLTDPVWSLPGVTTTYQWLRDEVPIPGADDPFYLPTLDDSGHQVSAAVTGSLLGVPAVTVVTDALPVPLPSGPPVTPAGDVTVDGSRKVGTTLSAAGPTWVPADATNTYQWLRDEAPIAGATASTYRLVPDDLGHAVAVKVTGHRDGWAATTLTSAPVTPLVGDAIQALTRPRLAGTAKVHRLLTADPGVWSGDGTAPSYSYQWRRDGVAIRGAVAQTYQARFADAGKRLSVTVTATRPAYLPGTSTSARVAVARIVSTLRARLADPVVRKGRRAALALVLEAPGVPRPGGTIRVYDGRRLLRTVTLAPERRGRATVLLPGLPPGVHRIAAVYAGTASVAPDRSRVARLTVRR